MKLGFIGDVHGDLPALAAAVAVLRGAGAEWTCCCGDLGLGFSDRAVFGAGLRASGLDATILGNHDEQEADGFNPRWRREYGMDALCLQLRRGRSVDVGGVRVLPMGGGESLDRAGRTPGVSWWHGESLRERDVAGARLDPAPDVVVSHTVPLSFVYREMSRVRDIYPMRWFGHSERLLDDLLSRMHRAGAFPRHWFAGHWHRPFQARYAGIEFHVLGRVDQADHPSGGAALLDTDTGRVDYPPVRREPRGEDDFQEAWASEITRILFRGCTEASTW